MGLTRTAEQMAVDALTRADQTVGAFRDRARVYRFLSESCRSLVSRLTSDFDETYWADQETVYAVSGQQRTDMPERAWKVITLRVTLAGERKAIGRASIRELDAEASSVGGWLARKPTYRIMGGAFVWVPIPRASHAVAAHYVPTDVFYDVSGNRKTALDTATDYFDGVDGWEQWVVLDTALKLKGDESKDAGTLIREQDQRWQEISAAASDRQESEPAQAQDTWRCD